MKIDKLSEFSLIKRIVKFCDQRVGDDAAVVKVNHKKCFLYTCDSLVSGEHFRESYITPYQIGRKAAAVNLSDIAAMGGKPKYLLVSLFLTRKTTGKFIDELYRGINHQCSLYGVTIIGGNIAKSNRLAIDIFLIGEAVKGKTIFRSGAKVGDLVLVTGTLGDSAAGLELLQNPQVRVNVRDRNKLIYRHLTPTPRVKEGRLIAKLKAHAMIDISDGLSRDLRHICEASGVGVRLFREKIPVSVAMRRAARLLKIAPLDLALNGGEDYELCFTVPPRLAPNICQQIEKITETKVTVIGRIVSEKQGIKHPLIPKGWDHFLS